MSNQMDTGMQHNQDTLKWLSQVNGDGKSHRQDSRELERSLKENEVYGFYTPDSDRYYRTVMLKKVGIDGVLKPLISNPVYGDIPPNIPRIKPEQIYKYMRMHNMSNMNNINAFPKTDIPKSHGGMNQ